MKCSVVNAATVLKQQQSKAQQRMKFPTRTAASQRDSERRQQTAVAAAAPKQSASRSGTKASGSSGSNTWNKLKRTLAAKKEELKDLAAEIEKTEQVVATERRAKEEYKLEALIVNKQLLQHEEENAKVVKSMVNDVLDGIERDACPECKRFFRFNRAL